MTAPPSARGKASSDATMNPNPVAQPKSKRLTASLTHSRTSSVNSVCSSSSSSSSIDNKDKKSYSIDMNDDDLTELYSKENGTLIDWDRVPNAEDTIGSDLGTCWTCGAGLSFTSKGNSGLECTSCGIFN